MTAIRLQLQVGNVSAKIELDPRFFMKHGVGLQLRIQDLPMGGGAPWRSRGAPSEIQGQNTWCGQGAKPP